MTSDEDVALLRAINDEDDPASITKLLTTYYHDADRADRTSRLQMYFHLGQLCGVILRMVADHQRVLDSVRAILAEVED